MRDLHRLEMEPLITSGTKWSRCFLGMRYDHVTGLLLAVYKLPDETTLAEFLNQTDSVRLEDESLTAVIEVNETYYWPANTSGDKG